MRSGNDPSYWARYNLYTAQKPYILNRGITKYEECGPGVRSVLFVTFLIALAALIIALLWWVLGSSRIATLDRAVFPSATPLTTVYVDAGAGSDSNSGAQTAPVQSIAQALLVLAAGNGTRGVVQLVGNATFDLGADPVLDFGPLVGRYATLFVQGTMQDVVQDTVQGIASIDATYLDWKEITGATGGYDPAAYRTHFVRNTVQDRVYVVENNTDSTVACVVGDDAVVPVSQSIPEVPVMGVPWQNGDTFELFTVEQRITWTGDFLVSIPYNSVNFKYVHMAPTTIQSRFRAPDGARHPVRFRGCRLEAWAISLSNPSYVGSMLFQGVYVQGMVANALYTGYQRNRCLGAESLWADGVAVRWSGDCYTLWMKLTNAQTDNAIVADIASQTYAIAIRVENPQMRSLIVSGASNAWIQKFNVLCDVGQCGGAATVVDVESNVVFFTLNVVCPACTFALDAQEGSDVRLAGNVNYETPQLITVSLRGNVDVLVTELLAPAVTGEAFLIGTDGALTLFPLVQPMTISALTLGVPIVENARGTLTLAGSGIRYAWSTDSGTPLISVAQGGVVKDNLSVDLVNGGPTATDIIQCGANAISAYAVAENDYSAGATQNCACSK